MKHAIALTFDNNLSANIRQLWDKFESHSIGYTPHKYKEPPHIKFSITDNADIDTITNLINNLSISDISLHLVPFGIFPSNDNMIFFYAKLVDEVHQSHIYLYQLLDNNKIQYDNFYSPNSVVFHCTIAFKIPDKELYNAISILKDYPSLLVGKADKLILYDYSSSQIIYERQL